jgi:hypothetical protein
MLDTCILLILYLLLSNFCLHIYTLTHSHHDIPLKLPTRIALAPHRARKQAQHTWPTKSNRWHRTKQPTSTTPTPHSKKRNKSSTRALLRLLDCIQLAPTSHTSKPDTKNRKNQPFTSNKHKPYLPGWRLKSHLGSLFPPYFHLHTITCFSTLSLRYSTVPITVP